MGFLANLGWFARWLDSTHLELYGRPMQIFLTGKLGELGLSDCSEGLLQLLNSEALGVWGRLKLLALVTLGQWDQPDVWAGKDTLGWFKRL